MNKTRLKDLREDRNLLQKDIAKMLNMKQQQYSRYETDQVEITTTLLTILADYYETSTDYILRRTNQQKPYPKA